MSPKGQGLISSYFATPGQDSTDDVIFLDDEDTQDNARPSKRKTPPEPDAPAPKRPERVVSVDTNAAFATSKTRPTASIKERLAPWRFDSAPSPSARAPDADKDRRHEAFRAKLLGLDHPFRRHITYAEKGNVWRPDGESNGLEPAEAVARLDSEMPEEGPSPSTGAEEKTPDEGSGPLDKFRAKGSRANAKKDTKGKGKAKTKYTPLEAQWIAIKDQHVGGFPLLVKLAEDVLDSPTSYSL
jgi:hypothetical protein